MTDWKTDRSEIIYETHWLTVRRNEVRNHRNKQLTYSFIQVRPSVFVVALNDASQLYVQQNYRYVIDKTTWGLPAGFRDNDDQDLLTAAKRELFEETGFTSDNWHELGTLYQATGVANIPCTVFLAQNIQASTGRQERDEQITAHTFVSFDTLEDMTQRGEFVESMHIAAVYLAKVHLLNKKGAK